MAKFFVIKEEKVKYENHKRIAMGDSWETIAKNRESAYDIMLATWEHLSDKEKVSCWVSVTEVAGNPKNAESWEWVSDCFFVSEVYGIEFLSKSFKDDIAVANQIIDGCLDEENILDFVPYEDGYTDYDNKMVYRSSDFEFDFSEHDFEEYGDIEVIGRVLIY